MRRKYTVWMEGQARIMHEGAEWEAFRADYKFVLAAGGAVTDERGRLLVIKRWGKWDLPKGKVDEGEEIEAAALREVNEECGLRTLRITEPMPSTWHTYARKGRAHLKCTHWFFMRGSSAEPLVPQHEEDIEEVKWVERAEVEAIARASYPSLRVVFDAWLAMEA
ncbi:MAG: NUDIX domain-containing protein [Flavobacteriales bacterium]|nr:NUDIX domain-containing protein [Flavobacteriales bacterium]